MDYIDYLFSNDVGKVEGTAIDSIHKVEEVGERQQQVCYGAQQLLKYGGKGGIWGLHL